MYRKFNKLFREKEGGGSAREGGREREREKYTLFNFQIVLYGICYQF